MRRYGLVSAFAFALALVGSHSALAQEMIEAGTSHGLPYVSGGIGLDSRDAMHARESEYNLMVMLTLKDGQYLGGGAITVRDQSGKTVLEVDAKGPWMFAKLPPGTYTVAAKIGDEIRSRKIAIGEKGIKRVVLAWGTEPG